MPEKIISNAGEHVRDNSSLRELKERMLDPAYLPTQSEIREAFKTDDEWDDFCQSRENPIYEFLNEEFIDKLSDYLSVRCAEQTGERPIVILEAGAGNGRLSHFLREKLEKKIPGKFELHATDSGEWELKTAFPVEQLDHKTALERYKPDMVIYSWMPYNEDMTADFRAVESVREYILIGEHGGCCGQPWLTWGLDIWPDYGDGSDGKEIAPFEKDGFEEVTIKPVSEEQMCRTDSPAHGFWHSVTVSFRRKTS